MADSSAAGILLFAGGVVLAAYAVEKAGGPQAVLNDLKGSGSTAKTANQPAAGPAGPSAASAAGPGACWPTANRLGRYPCTSGDDQPFVASQSGPSPNNGCWTGTCPSSGGGQGDSFLIDNCWLIDWNELGYEVTNNGGIANGGATLLTPPQNGCCGDIKALVVQWMAMNPGHTITAPCGFGAHCAGGCSGSL